MTLEPQLYALKGRGMGVGVVLGPSPLAAEEMNKKSLKAVATSVNSVSEVPDGAQWGLLWLVTKTEGTRMKA